MKKKTKSYFFKSFFTIICATASFIILKEILPKKIFEETANLGGPSIVIDSLAIKAMANTEQELLVEEDSTLAAADSIVHPYVYISSTDNTEGLSYLSHFFEKLYELETSKQGKVRIAYFSDSMTDGDLIVQDIRSLFQNKFGGKGVGFVGITSLSANARYSVTHQFSKDWLTQTFLNNKKPNRAYGIDGQVVFAPHSSWVKYQANDQANSTLLYNPTLFFGSSSNPNATVDITVGKDSAITVPLHPNKLLNTYKIAGSPKSIKLQFNDADSIPFYGINSDNGQGLHIDNFSIRGNSGLPLSLFNKNLMNAFDDALQYDLIVLHYGANVLGYGTTDYGWYNNKMLSVTNHLKQCFPHANILVVSTADRAIKEDTEMKTDKAVRPLIVAQKAYAKNSQSAFLNLYTLMGGDGSMIQWVNETPPLANKDYTHFSAKGSKKIGKLIYGELEKGYLKYKKLRDEGSIE